MADDQSGAQLSRRGFLGASAAALVLGAGSKVLPVSPRPRYLGADLGQGPDTFTVQLWRVAADGLQWELEGTYEVPEQRRQMMDAVARAQLLDGDLLLGSFEAPGGPIDLTPESCSGDGVSWIGSLGVVQFDFTKSGGPIAIIEG